MKTLTGYWYHYAIMFEALFILTTVDTGTRVARYVMHELLGKVHKPFSNTAWLPGNLVTSAIVVLSWGYLIYTGNISTLWPLFGTGNQLLATIALAVVTTFLVNMGKAKYAYITAIPMCFVGVTTLTAGVLSIKNIYLPLAQTTGPCLPGLSRFLADGDFHRRSHPGGNRVGTTLLADSAWGADSRRSLRQAGGTGGRERVGASLGCCSGTVWN